VDLQNTKQNKIQFSLKHDDHFLHDLWWPQRNQNL